MYTKQYSKLKVIEEASPEHKLFLQWLYLAREKLNTVLEIGVATGASTKFWVPWLPQDGMYVGIDINLHNESQGLFGKVKEVIDFYKDDKRMNFILGDSQDPSVVESAEKFLNGRKVDLLFIDGEHSYERATSDFLLYEKFLASNTVIVWHDATRNTNVRNAIEDIILPWGDRGKYGSEYDLAMSRFKVCCEFNHAVGHCGIKVLVKK